jgi:hypothetical protein
VVRVRRRGLPTHAGQRGTRQARETRDFNPLPIGVVDEGSGATTSVHAAAERAFWDWAVVEVLRLTGIRHEELLELTHLSVRRR